MFLTHFKHEIHLWYEPCWKLCWKPCQIFQSVLKTMLKISRHVENHVKNFKVCRKSLMWLLRDPFHQFWNIIAVIKIKSDIINEDYRSLWCYMWSLIESYVVLKRKLGPFVCNPCIMCMLWKIFEFNLAVNFLYFLSNWVNLLGIFSGIRKPRAFERNPCFWNGYLMPWRWIIKLLWEYWKMFASLFP